jgi:hypothetical protein
MARICRDDLPDGLSEIFLQEGLDRVLGWFARRADLLNWLNNFIFRAGLFGENFLRLTPMDAPDRARRVAKLPSTPGRFAIRWNRRSSKPSFMFRGS